MYRITRFLMEYIAYSYHVFLADREVLPNYMLLELAHRRQGTVKRKSSVRSLSRVSYHGDRAQRHHELYGETNNTFSTIVSPAFF